MTPLVREEPQATKAQPVATTDVSIIIVSYNTAELTLAAIRSVYEQTRQVSFELIVVDNNSNDGSADLIGERFPDLMLIRLDYNAGFAAANNLATEEATGRYILLLNPDTVVLDGAIDKLVAFAEEHPEYGIYGGSTFFADGTRNPTAGWMKPSLRSMLFVAIGLARVFPKARLLHPESLAGWTWDRPRKVDIVTGCLMLSRRLDWFRIGGFDSRYFMYGEDADLCLRAEKLDLPSVVYPVAGIVHYGGASELLTSSKIIRLFGTRNAILSQHFGRSRAFVGSWLLRVHCILRITLFWVAGLYTAAARSRFREWLEVWRRRSEWIVTKKT